MFGDDRFVGRGPSFGESVPHNPQPTTHNRGEFFTMKRGLFKNSSWFLSLQLLITQDDKYTNKRSS